MLIVKKALNSSVLLVEDDKKKEFILMGKGVGYGHRPGDHVENDGQSKIFVPVDNSVSQNLMELAASIPLEYFEITQDIVSYSSKILDVRFSDNIYLLLTDHLKFAVERYKNNILVVNRVYWEIKNFYPMEFKAGQYALSLLNERFDVNLPDEEAANIAFHLVNAQTDKELGHDAMRVAKFISAVVSLIKYTLNQDFNTESLHYSRFISHMQFFAERFFSGKLIDNGDDFLYEQMKCRHEYSIKCADKVALYIDNNYNKKLPKEELAYLAVHIQRLISAE